ncbi:MAG: methyl-accepting chemotaxis protein [Psychrosphaera sp.]|nr:methyl-accepting chemotaxis protein [Psychrosphaera sp.]
MRIVIVMMTLSLVFSALFTALISSSRYYSAMSSFSSEKYLPELLGAMAGDIQSELNSLIGMSRALGQNSYLKNWLLAGEPQEQMPQVKQMLGALKDYSNATRAFWVSKKTNNYYTATHGLKKTISIEEDPWFDSFIRSGKDHSIDLAWSHAGVMRAFINVRVEHQNQVIGATGLSFEVKKFNQLLNQKQLGDDGQIFLLDRNAKVAVHQNSEYIGKRLDEIGDFAAIANGLTQNTGYFNDLAKIGGEDYYVSSLKMKDTGFSLVALMPTQPFTTAMLNNAFSTVIGNLLIAFIFLAIMAIIIRRISGAIINMSNQLEQVSQNNDLSIRLVGNGSKELVKIAAAYNQMAESFTLVIKNLSRCSQTLSQNSGELQQVASGLNQGAQTQVQETTTIMHEIGELKHADDEIKAKVQSSQSVTSNTKNKSDTGKAMVEQTRQAISQLDKDLSHSTDIIGKLEHDSTKIAGILAVISGIADQTNLLALNAAIEAARAGEQGRGFAVVADEVRALAGKTQLATSDIQAMVANITSGVEQTVKSMRSTAVLASECMEKSERVSQIINEVNDDIDNIDRLTNSINEAVSQRDVATKSIEQRTTDIHQIATTSAQSTQTSLQTTDTLLGLSTELGDTVASFKL